MSMLAEPRRKQKWSVDPRNSAWSNDESKFGQKMLERMGWSKGKGLGKSEQGATEHIKVKVKNNSLGLGTTISHEDNWIAHQDDFNQLLAELNNCHGQNNSEEPSQEQAEEFSLEAKSKTSKKRVHYMKFTKGKDLSNRSETDLACIFGKRSKRTKDQDEASNDADSQEEKEQDTSDMNGQFNPEVELNTVTSTLTMQEYFAQRMAQLKKVRGESQSTNADPGNSISQSPLPTSESIEGMPNTSSTEVSKEKKKRKKKDRRNRQGDEEKVEDTVEAPMTADSAVEQDDSERKKKKKKKDDRLEENTAEECSIPAEEMDTTGDAASASTHKKKKKRKNKETPTLTPTDSVNEKAEVEETMDNAISDKKKKKRTREEEEQSDVIVAEKKSKKDKKKKMNH